VATPEEYLGLLEDRPDDQTETAFNESLLVVPSVVRGWAIDTKGFAAEREKIRERRKWKGAREAQAANVIDRATTLAAERQKLAALRRQSDQMQNVPEGEEADLSADQKAFLEAMEEHDDRLQALKAVGVSWSTVQGWARESKAFYSRYLSIMGKWVIGVEDATMRKARDGNVRAAQMYLQAHDPARYSPRVKVEHSGTLAVTAEGAESQKSWLDQFIETRAIRGQLKEVGSGATATADATS
jgi:hypothetical protein